MTIAAIIGLAGLKSTDPKLLQWFERYRLTKPSKTVSVNQGSKSINQSTTNLIG